MTDEEVIIENLPDVRDINVLLEAIEEIGARVDRIDRHTARINARHIKEVSVDDEYIRKIRASYYFIGALLGSTRAPRFPCRAAAISEAVPLTSTSRAFGLWAPRWR